MTQYLGLPAWVDSEILDALVAGECDTEDAGEAAILAGKILLAAQQLPSELVRRVRSALVPCFQRTGLSDLELVFEVSASAAWETWAGRDSTSEEGPQDENEPAGLLGCLTDGMLCRLVNLRHALDALHLVVSRLALSNALPDRDRLRFLLGEMRGSLGELDEHLNAHLAAIELRLAPEDVDPSLLDACTGDVLPWWMAVVKR